VSQRLGYGREPIPGGALAWTNWIAGIVAVYATLFGIGKIVFGFTGAGIVMLAIAAAAFYWISRPSGARRQSQGRRRSWPEAASRPLAGTSSWRGISGASSARGCSSMGSSGGDVCGRADAKVAKPAGRRQHA